MTGRLLITCVSLLFLLFAQPAQSALFGNPELSPAFCKLPTARRTVVYIDDMSMVDGATAWALRLADKLRATLAPGEHVTVVRLSPATGQSAQIWSGCWPAFTAAERARIAGQTYFFHESPLSSLPEQQKLFLHGLSEALGQIYLAGKRPLNVVRVDPAHPPTKNLIRALASDEGRFSQSAVTTRAIIYSDMAENSDLGSAFAPTPSTAPHYGEKLGTYFRRSVFYAYGAGADVAHDPGFIEAARRFWNAAFASMNAAVGGIGPDLNMPNVIPIAAHIFAADLKMEDQDVQGVLSVMVDADGDLVDSWLGFGRLSIATIHGSFRCTGTGSDTSCRLSAITARGIATESASETLDLSGNDQKGLSGSLGVKGALTFPLTASATGN